MARVVSRRKQPAGRRPPGTGSVYRDGTRWVGAVQVDGRRRKVTAATEAEARARLDQLLAALGRGLDVDDATRTVGAWLAHWVAYIAPDRDGARSPNTIDGYRWAVARIDGALGRRALRELRTTDVERFLATEAATSARSTVARIRSTLILALDAAVARDIVVRNVARVTAVPRAARPPREGRTLTVEEAGCLLAAVENDRLEALWITGLLCGLRPGEVAGLCWQDIDLDAGRLTVTRARVRHHGTDLALADPKTTRSRRTLALPRRVIDALRAHRARQASERLAAGGAWITEPAAARAGGLVFTTTVGTLLDPSAVRKHLARLTVNCGLGRWAPNELRHSAASLLSAAGVPIEVVADVLGHRDTRMLEIHYRHRVVTIIDDGVAPMDAYFGAS